MGISTLNRAIFLDRDGILNHAVIKNGLPYPPTSVMDLTIPDDVLPALQTLKKAGYLLICVTNQPDVARGTTSKTCVEAINAKLIQILPLDQVLVCYHDNDDRCDCRKPEPGLLLQAAREHQIDLSQSYMIGDRWKDIHAGFFAGCKTIWLDFQYNEPKPKHMPHLTTQSLSQAADWILQQ